jgi:hypothetical protein
VADLLSGSERKNSENPLELQVISQNLLFDVGLKGNEEKPLVNSYAIFSGLKFKTTSYNHEGAPFFLVISIYQGSINSAKDDKQMFTFLGQKDAEKIPPEKDEDGTDGECSSSEEEVKEPPRVLLTKISPPLYINSRKLAKESSTKKYHTVIEPFDIQSVEQDLYIRSNKILQRPQVANVLRGGASQA